MCSKVVCFAPGTRGVPWVSAGLYVGGSCHVRHRCAGGGVQCGASCPVSANSFLLIVVISFLLYSIVFVCSIQYTVLRVFCSSSVGCNEYIHKFKV